MDQLEIDIADVPPGRRGGYATELREFLLAEGGVAQIDIVRSDPGKQDLGATLIIAAGAAAIAVAKGLQKWVAKRNTSSVIVKCGKGKEVRVTNISGKRADELARELSEICG
ncbi:effector-associated constant component EACC1 [Winogradskya humida]|uniref:Uncharacterized protein n=1 Tax=Winogradskya humida TaxID=113566 RepID=A0ABQ3ZJL3_9ACTN|nr:hypothetical protein [Actinoplanes humidus]GIE18683.1 hypothetical protein Ahu01nite_017850 [Actinoplanes humidus]